MIVDDTSESMLDDVLLAIKLMGDRKLLFELLDAIITQLYYLEEEDKKEVRP